MSRTVILGISAYFHDSAAAILVDGEIVAAAHEERFSRKKQDERFPKHSIKYVMQEAGVELADLTNIVFYDKPFLKFERLLETYHHFAPKGVQSFLMAMPVWIKDKLFLRNIIWKELHELFPGEKTSEERTKLLFSEHHLSHASSAYYPSAYDDAAILTIDGVGEWATTTISHGRGKNIEIVSELKFPNSIGLLYSAFTYYCGFKVNSGEYKLMGLAPYGNNQDAQVSEFEKKILSDLIDLKEDGSIALNQKYFDYAVGLRMCRDKEWEKLFGIAKRPQESDLTQEYMNLALAIQKVTNEIVLRLARTAKKLTNSPNLVMAGGVALNCVSNGLMRQEKIFDNIWIQPAAGDAGGALGAAYVGWHIYHGHEKKSNNENTDYMKGSYLGPEYSDIEVRRMERKFSCVSTYLDKEENLYEQVADKISQGNVVGWFQGRMEWGPRALGNRSILGDPRHPEMQKKLNLKIKYREGFRPFAPSVLSEDAKNYFTMGGDSPYMLFVDPVESKKRTQEPNGYNDWELYKRLYHVRSEIPAVTHIDYSARIQTVHKNTNPRYWNLISKFKEKTGCGLVINTSFNVRGEPIVCTPEDAYRCFMRTEMDYLVIGDRLYDKKLQPKFVEDTDWRQTHTLD